MHDYLLFQAKEMVSLSKTIVTKIRDKQGEITEDEVCCQDSFYFEVISYLCLDDKPKFMTSIWTCLVCTNRFGHLQVLVKDILISLVSVYKNSN